MSLYTTELRRLGKRRFVRYMTLLALLVLAGLAVFTFVTNEKIGPEQQAAAQHEADRQYQQQVQFLDQQRQRCEQVKASGTEQDKKEFPPDCSEMQPPPREAIEARWFLPPTFDFRAKFGKFGTAFAAILALVAFVVGASFVGAEWHTGGMMNLLLWRPKRLTVLLTKLGALLTGVLGTTVVFAAAYTGAFWAVATVHGRTDTMTSGAWQSFALMGLRALVLVLVSGLVGFALASLGRHTALALGGVLAAVVVGQFGVGVVLEMAKVKFVEAWLVPTYLMAWMQQKVTLRDYDSCVFSPLGGCRPETMDIVWQDTAVLLAVSVLLALGAAMWAMRRRDIT